MSSSRKKVLIQYIVSKHDIEGSPTYVKYNNRRISKRASSISFGSEYIWCVLQPQATGSYVLSCDTVDEIAKKFNTKISKIIDKYVSRLCYEWGWNIIIFIEDDVDVYDITNLRQNPKKLMFMR